METTSDQRAINDSLPSVAEYQETHPEMPAGDLLSSYAEELHKQKLARAEALGVSAEELHRLPPQHIAEKLAELSFTDHSQ